MPTPICGDGLRVQGEACDDGIANDYLLEGCLLNCTGAFKGWHCSGGSPTTPDACVE